MTGVRDSGDDGGRPPGPLRRAGPGARPRVVPLACADLVLLVLAASLILGRPRGAAPPSVAREESHPRPESAPGTTEG